MSVAERDAQSLRMIADLVHDDVVDSILLRVLIVAEPEAEALRVKALKVLHVQVIFSARRAITVVMQGVIVITPRTPSML